MAKKQKRSSGATGLGLPDLSEASFASLTNKIESKLQAPRDSKSPNTTKSKKTSSKFEGRGQKRNHEGKVLKTEKIPSKPEKKNAPKDDLEALRAEIIALGGTEADLDLVAGLESASELEDEAPSSKPSRKAPHNDDSLRNDIAKMLKDMGVEGSAKAATTAAPEEDDFEDISETEEDGMEVPDEVVAGEEIQEAEPDNVGQSNKSGRSRLTVTPQAEWHAIRLPEIGDLDSKKASLSNRVVEEVHKYAKELLDTENQAYQTSQKASSSSSQKFYDQVISSGTLSDKISALTLAVQESPIHNVKSLETLLGLAKKRSRAQAIDVLRALKDLFAQGSLLPSDRRLRTFVTQPSLIQALDGVKNWAPNQRLPNGIRPQHLIIWAYEHWLKDVYFEVLKILETWCNDELDFSKSRALSYVYELLKEKPEQESNLLRLLVNKLGDRAKRIASRASYLLLQLEQAHPLMKPTIAASMENELLWRPGQALHAKYYAVITLNQTVLSAKEEGLASKLLDIYFGLFVALLKPAELGKASKPKSQVDKDSSRKPQAGKINIQDEELREKLVTAILTGINRAYPYVLAEREKVTEHMDTLFRITHSSNFNTSIQAMLLIQQLTVSNQMSSDRFYRTLYESLLDPRLVTSSKQSLYLNLLFRSLKADLNVKRVKAFAKRILQVVALHQAAFVVGCFHLLKELEATFPSLKALIDESEEQDLEEEHFMDVDEDRNQDLDKPNGVSDDSERVFYDGKKRDPEHSNADRSCLWELLPYLAHYHPSVSVGASSVLTHTPLSGKPDLSLYTLIHFLDRFVYRNPKTSAAATLRGSSVMQPSLASGDISTSLFNTSNTGNFSGGPAQSALPVNNSNFWQKKLTDIAAEDVFFHQYFSSLGKDKLSKKQQKRKGANKADADGGDDEDEEGAIWKAITESNPALEGGADDSDDELDMSDLESAYDKSEDDDDEDLLNLDDLSDSDSASASASDSGTGPADFEGVELVGFDSDDDNEDLNQQPVSDDASDEEGKEEDPTESQPKASKSKFASKKESSRDRKRKLKSLPTFASVDEYRHMIENDDDQDGQEEEWAGL